MRASPLIALASGLFMLGMGMAWNFWERVVVPHQAAEEAWRQEGRRLERRRLELEERRLEWEMRRFNEDRERRWDREERLERRSAPAPYRPPLAPPSMEQQQTPAEAEELRKRQLAEAEASRLAQTRRAAEQKLYDRLRASMQSARYAFNHPEIMYLTRRSQITLTLAAHDNEALDALRRQFDQAIEGTVTVGETKYAPVMIATLRGKDFKIEPAGGEQKMVLLTAKGPTAWTWFVEPLELGKGKLLILDLSARIDKGNEKLPPLTIKTFEARINVDVRIWDRIVMEARRMSPIAQALSGIGGFVAFLGFVGTSRRWLRKIRKNKAPAMDSSPPIT